MQPIPSTSTPTPSPALGPSSPSEREPGERGDALTETVLVTGVLIVFILAVMQFVLWGHAVHIAQAAAREGARAARVAGGTVQDGQDVAAAFIRRAGPGLILDPAVSAMLDPDAAKVEVSGHAPRLVPFLRLPVRAVSQGPTERFRPPGVDPLGGRATP